MCMLVPIITYCSSQAAGGLELNVVRMALWLRDAGHPVTVATTPGSEIARRAEAKALPVVQTGRPGGTPSLWRLWQALRKVPCHTLLVHTSKDLRRAVIARALARSNAKLVFVQHMQLGQSKRDFLHTLFYRRLSAWIAPLPYLAKQVTKLTRLPPQRVYEIPFATELENLRPGRYSRQQARFALGLPQQPLIAGGMGRFDEQKNQALLIRAAAPMIRAGYPLQLLFVGENTRGNRGDYEGTLRRLAAQLDVGDHVHFRPFEENVALAYAALDLFVLTSQCETFGMVTVEAMAAGLPIIATRSGGTPEIIRDKHDGLLFQPDDATDLENALRLLADYPDLRLRFGRQAEENALRRFSHRDYVSRLDRLISTA